MANDETALLITAQSVERGVNPASGEDELRVRLHIADETGSTIEWAIWVPGEEDFTAAIEVARRDLHRISSQIAASPPSGTPQPSEPDPRGPGKAREAKYRANQSRGSGYT